MPSRRTLVLKSERLAELGHGELGAVVGAAATQLCLSELVNHCYSTDYIQTLCGCLTSYCSIDVC